MIRGPPKSTPFPYPALFRSPAARELLAGRAPLRLGAHPRRRVGGRRGEHPRRARRRGAPRLRLVVELLRRDRKSTRLNSSHANISYAVLCLKKKNIISTSYS